MVRTFQNTSSKNTDVKGLLTIKTLTPGDELTINGDRCKFRPCFSARKPAISRGVLAIHFPDTTCGKRTYKFAKINEQTKYAVERAENRKMGGGETGRQTGRGRIKYRACHICAAIWWPTSVIVKSDRHARTFVGTNDFLGTNERAHPRQRARLPATSAGGYRSAVRDKNRRYEEYRWRPIECSCQYLNDTVTWPLVDSFHSWRFAARDHVSDCAPILRSYDPTN